MAKDTKKSKKTAAADNGSSSRPVMTQILPARLLFTRNISRIYLLKIQMRRAFSSKAQASLMLKSPSMLAPSFLAIINMK